MDPVFLQLGTISLYWYGLMYVIAFLFAYFFLSYLRKDSFLTKDQFETSFLVIMLSSIVGGRLGYIVFYNLSYYLSNPEMIFRVDMGGMSIHGGFIGAAIGVVIISKLYDKSFFKLSDFFILPTAFGLALGRIGNFINQELVGTPTSSLFGIEFSQVDSQTRHPYQLYASFKNLVVFQITTYLYFFKNLKTGHLTLYFILLYNVGRFFLDFFREPTIDLGVISLGQLLCLIFIVLALYGFVFLSNKKN